VACEEQSDLKRTRLANLPISLTDSLAVPPLRVPSSWRDRACVDQGGWCLFRDLLSVDMAPARPDLCIYGSVRRYRSCYHDHIHLERIRWNTTRLRRRLVL